MSEPLAMFAKRVDEDSEALSGKQWTSMLARGLAASVQREVIVTVEAAKASATQKAEGESKNMFSL